MRVLTLAALLLAVTPSLADDNHDAAAALALAAASKPHKPTRHDVAACAALAAAVADCHRDRLPVTWEVAAAECKKTGRPVFLRVGKLDCSALCPRLRKAGIIVAHELTSVPAGTQADRLYLIVPAADGSLLRLHEWASVPAEADVLREVEQWKAGRGARAAPASPVAVWNAMPRNQGSCPCGQTGGCHCSPHSDCARGNCATHNPLLKPAPAVPQTYYAPAWQFGTACRT